MAAVALGWHHALWALGYLIGAIGPIAVLAVLCALLLPTARYGRHQVTVLRLRRQNRRAGREPSYTLSEPREWTHFNGEPL